MANKKKICDVLGCNNKAKIKVELIDLYKNKHIKYVCSEHYEMLKNHAVLLFKSK